GIQAANARALQANNRSAPRLLRPAAGECAVQASCVPASAEKPAVGGRLLWTDAARYLCLDRGTRGPWEVSFSGCLGDRDIIIGRGRLCSERMWLRLEGIAGRVHALCNADGEEWLTVGHVEFTV